MLLPVEFVVDAHSKQQGQETEDAADATGATGAGTIVVECIAVVGLLSVTKEAAEVRDRYSL